MKDPSHQLTFLVGGAPEPRPRQTTRRENRRAARYRGLLTPLIPKRRFLPIVGTPPTRGDCPDTTKAPCPFVFCRHHLWRVDACDRAGRPGLSDVPRDRQGHTLSLFGDVGEERPTGELWLAWLDEIERECKVVLVRDDEGRITDVDTYEGWETFREHTHDGEPLEVLDDAGKVIGAAELTAEGVRLKGVQGGYVVTLRRVRGVPSCALDEADKGPRSNEQVGDAIGRHRTLAARVIRGGLIKMRAAGVDVRDLVSE